MTIDRSISGLLIFFLFFKNSWVLFSILSTIFSNCMNCVFRLSVITVWKLNSLFCLFWVKWLLIFLSLVTFPFCILVSFNRYMLTFIILGESWILAILISLCVIILFIVLEK
jgi:hypothetical protein